MVRMAVLRMELDRAGLEQTEQKDLDGSDLDQ